MSDTPQFYVQANFPNEGWRNVFDTSYEREHAFESLYYSKRDNPELEHRLINVLTHEMINEVVSIETYSFIQKDQ